eukprot:3509413-Prymnesium_polylepis.1
MVSGAVAPARASPQPGPPSLARRRPLRASPLRPPPPPVAPSAAAARLHAASARHPLAPPSRDGLFHC